VFILDWVWNGGFSQVTIWKDGTAQGGVSGTWVAPTFGASIALGSDVAGANQASGTYSDVMIGV
jgi:hypothetical protein